MTVIIRFKGEDVEVIRGVKKIEDISGWIEIDNQKYMKSDILNIEIIWREYGYSKKKVKAKGFAGSNSS